MALDEEEWEQTGAHEIGDPDLSPETDEDEYGDEDPEQDMPIQTPGYPQVQVRRRIKNAIDGYQASQLEVVDTLEQVLSRLRILSSSSDRLVETLSGPRGSEAKVMLANIIEWATEAKEKYAGGEQPAGPS